MTTFRPGAILTLTYTARAVEAGDTDNLGSVLTDQRVLVAADVLDAEPIGAVT
jgi:hypothetical protein